MEENCWLVNYVDVEPGAAALDYRCLTQTYEGHKGTDIALRSMRAMESGVAVKAAMAGEVIRLRDGETDTQKTESDLEAIKTAQKECGNGILIDHAIAGYPGLRTMYCHLKKGSIEVDVKEEVAAGEKIAEIGHSGFTEFPHLHFGVFWEGAVIDPFTGAQNIQGCGQPGESMWVEHSIKSQPVGFYNSGFRSQTPDFEAIKAGEENPDFLPLTSNSLVYWVAFYGIRKGDEITLEILDPQRQRIVARTITQPKSRARQFYYTGRKFESSPLAPGQYKGIMQLSRDGRLIKSHEETILIR